MSVVLPIISQFDNTGIKRAQKEFSQLETVGQKAQFAIKKAAIPAALAVGALAAAGKSALAAGEEVNSANNRILQINTAMGLFGSETQKVTDRITKLAEAQGTELGISNLTIKATQAKLLTFKNLAKSANTVGGAFDRANKAALDMAAAGFGSAEVNAVQLGKALENPIKGIAALAKSGVTFTEQEKDKIKTLVESNKMLEAQEIVLAAIETQVGGTAKATADDTDRMKEGFAQFQQSLGLGLLPILEAVTPVLLGMANWAKENPGTFKVLAAAIGAIAISILAINAAMALNPISAIAIGVVALIAGVVLAYKRFETFRNIVDTIFSGIKIGFGLVVDYLKFVAGIYKGIFNGIAKAWNNTVGKISFEIPSWVPKIGGKGFSVPQIPMLAQGGIVNQATLAVIGEAGPEAVIPLDRMSEFGAGGGGINVTVNAGLMSSPDQVGQQIIEAIQKAQRRSGVVFAPA
jgi:hypothetical protein